MYLALVLLLGFGCVTHLYVLNIFQQSAVNIQVSKLFL